MAGSLVHIIDDSGNFRMDLIENLGDAEEALEQCFRVIKEMSRPDTTRLPDACTKLGILSPCRLNYEAVIDGEESEA